LKYRGAAENYAKISKYTYDLMCDVLEYKTRFLNPSLLQLSIQELEYYSASAQLLTKLGNIDERLRGVRADDKTMRLNYDPFKFIRGKGLINVTGTGTGMDNRGQMDLLKEKTSILKDRVEETGGFKYNQDLPLQNYQVGNNVVSKETILQEQKTTNLGMGQNVQGNVQGFPLVHEGVETRHAMGEYSENLLHKGSFSHDDDYTISASEGEVEEDEDYTPSEEGMHTQMGNLNIKNTPLHSEYQGSIEPVSTGLGTQHTIQHQGNLQGTTSTPSNLNKQTSNLASDLQGTIHHGMTIPTSNLNIQSGTLSSDVQGTIHHMPSGNHNIQSGFSEYQGTTIQPGMTTSNFNVQQPTTSHYEYSGTTIQGETPTVVYGQTTFSGQQPLGGIIRPGTQGQGQGHAQETYTIPSNIGQQEGHFSEHQFIEGSDLQQQGLSSHDIKQKGNYNVTTQQSGLNH
jgi:hypothetical protein